MKKKKIKDWTQEKKRMNWRPNSEKKKRERRRTEERISEEKKRKKKRTEDQLVKKKKKIVKGQKLRLWVPPCVFNYKNAIELWVMKTENS